MGKEIKDIGQLQKTTKVEQCECRRLIVAMVHITTSTGAIIFNCFLFFEEINFHIFYRETTHKTPPGFKSKKKKRKQT